MLKKLLFFLSFLALVCSCEKSNIEEAVSNNKQNVEVVPDEGTVISGRIRIKLEKEISGIEDIAASLPDMKIISVSRTFPDGGIYEQRRRNAGLHLWYDITFDREVPVTKAARDIARLDGIKYIEYVRPVKTASIEYPFNDSLLSNQWHYYNSGEKTGYVAGADANVVNAWNYNTGSEDVIVAIIDSGIEATHEDLAGAMWINEAEANGEVGVDDDGNGYIDDINGYNFVASGINMIGMIYPADHGTHVAGTVGAINNNGVGVCGVAGGDGIKKGVRLMDCQIIRYENEGSYTGTAFVYAADNGAVIANCSFSQTGGGEIDQSTKEGIDYFVKNAGTDKNGNQIALVKGGLVIAAAGNYSTNSPCYPATYEKAIAVASIGPDYKLAYYSNYGDWVDVTAPGGDYKKGGTVLSCVTGNSYGQMQGTSQATPHVTGIAALVVSRFGKAGFTCDMARYIIEHGCRNIDEYNPTFVGQMGAGLIDAVKCLDLDDTERPLTVEKIWTSSFSNYITLKWLVGGNKGTVPFAYDLYYSKSPLDKLDLDQPLPEGVNKVTVSNGSMSAGDTLSYELSKLEFTTKYYFKIDAYNVHNNHSGLSDQVSESTLKNMPPQISPFDGTSLTLKAFQTGSMRFAIVDPDNHDLYYSYNKASIADYIQFRNDTLVVTVEAVKVSAGEYSSKLVVQDEYGTADSIDISYTVLPNNKPYVVANPDNVVMSKVGETATINLAAYIKDLDGEPLNYAVSSSSSSVVANTAVSGDVLTLTGKWYGTDEYTVIATDAKGASCSVSFSLLLRDGTQEIDLFPNPMDKVMNLRTGEEHQAKVSIYSTLGSKVYDGTLQIGPFNGASVDVSSFGAGDYTVYIEFDGKEIKRNVVKL